MKYSIQHLKNKGYFLKVKSRQDWEAADRSDCGAREWAEHFPNTYPDHQAVTKLYKRYKKEGKL